MITPDTLEEAIRQEFGDGYPYAWTEVGSGTFNLTVDGEVYEVDVIENTTTYEFVDGDTDGYPLHRYHIVLLIEGLFFQKIGVYQSMDGSDWRTPPVLVRPVSKTITVFETV